MAKKPTGGFKHWAAAGFKDTLLRCQMKKEVQLIQDRLNHRPRKRLGFKTPHQVFYTSINRRALRA